MPLEDADDLLRRCQLGEEEALDALIRLFQTRLFRLAFRVLGQATLAEEATVDTFTKIWTNSRQWRREASASTWIYQIAYRTVLDTRKRARRWWQRGGSAPDQTLSASHSDPAQQALEADHQKHNQRRLQQALAQLSSEERALVHLYYFEDRPLAEIEPILGVGRPALKMRLARIRQRLRELLQDFDG